MRWRLTAFIAALLLCQADFAIGQQRARVVSRIADAPRFTTTPVQAKLGQSVELTVQVSKTKRLAKLPAGAKVRWLQVMPRMQHKLPTKRTQGHRIYSNSIMFGPNHGRWVGADRLEYETVELEERVGAKIDGTTLRLERARATKNGGRGSLWIAAEVTLPDGTTLRTPDGSTVDHLGLSRKVMRVSFRTDDTFVGWLGTYFNVPYVFGSTGAQSDNYTGTDCADAMVAGRRAQGHRRVRYTSVAGLERLTKASTAVLTRGDDGIVRDAEGTKTDLRWGADIKRGDLLVMDFIDDPNGALPRPWDHVATVVSDGSAQAAPNGIFDADDIVRHMTTWGLVDAPFSGLGQIRFRLWRWR